MSGQRQLLFSTSMHQWLTLARSGLLALLFAGTALLAGCGGTAEAPDPPPAQPALSPPQCAPEDNCVTSDSITLTWTVAGTVASFELQWSATAGSWPSTGIVLHGPTRSWTHDGLEPNQTWFYRIRAINAQGLKSDWSRVVSATTHAAPPISGPLRINVAGYPDTLELPVDQVTRRALPTVSGGTPPYVLSLTGCPDWIQHSGGDLLAYPPSNDPGVPVPCTFSATDSATPVPASVSHGFFVRAAHPEPTAFYFEPRHIQERNLPVGQSISPIALPRALNGRPATTGGKVELTYRLTPALPAGLCLYATTADTPPTTDQQCPTDPRYSYQHSPDDATEHLWIIGTPTFSSALNRYCWSVSDKARTTPPAERCFHLATVSHDVPRFTNVPGLTRSLVVHSIVVSRTSSCGASASTELCPIVGSTTPSSRTGYDVHLPIPVLPPGFGQGVYTLKPRFGVGSPFQFLPATDPPRVRWTPPSSTVATPLTAYTYGVSRTANAAASEAAICLDLRFARSGDTREVVVRSEEPRVAYTVSDWAVTYRFRDEPIRRSTGEFVCLPRPLGDDSPTPTNPPADTSSAPLSNPVHEALGPVHARRAAGAAHAVVRERVRSWSPGAPARSAFFPSVELASVSGRSEGFDYHGSSESLRGGAELGAGAWQAGVVASCTRTDLRYDAVPALAGEGYRAGEHDTEILSLHPFAAWHLPAGGHLWASLGAGSGDLRHRDDPGFPSWSRSDVQLRTWAVGASAPLGEMLHGELRAQAGVESFAFEIEGGGRISSALPRLHGRDWRAGLEWSAPLPGAPALSLAYRRLGGDGPEGAQMEARASAAFAGLLDSRLALTGSAEAALGLGDYDQDTWSLDGGLDFAPDPLGRGVRLDLDTRVVSLDEGRSAGIGVQAEAGYGLWGGPFLGELRPYTGLALSPGEDSLRRSVGLYLHDTPASQVRVEVHDHTRDLSRGIGLQARYRF